MPIQEEPPITEKFQARGNSVYGCCKFMGETYVREHTPHIILRYAHLYGAEKRMHGLIGGFLDRISFGMAPVLFGGKQSNDFLYIKDVAKANMLALTAPWDKWNQVYNIGSGEELSAEEAGQIVCDAAGYKGEIDIKEGRTVDASRFVYDMSKAKEMLGFTPDFTFREGIKDMLQEVELKNESAKFYHAGKVK
jgi:UDP-glucose 4-epimerase